MACIWVHQQGQPDTVYRELREGTCWHWQSFLPHHVPAGMGMHPAGTDTYCSLSALTCLLLLLCLGKASWMVRQGCRVPPANARLLLTLSVQHTKPVAQSCQPLNPSSPPAATICSLPLQDAASCCHDLQPAIAVYCFMPQPLRIP